MLTFGMEYYKMLEKIKTEMEKARPYLDYVASHQETFNQLVKATNESFGIAQKVAAVSERMDKIFEPLIEYQKLWNQNYLGIANAISEFQIVLEEQVYTLSKQIQREMSVMAKYSQAVEAIYQERLIEKCVENIDYAEEKIEVSSEEITKVYNDVRNAADDPKNWQQKINDVIREWKEKNPVLFSVLVYFILPLIISVIATPIYNAITQNNTQIKDEPSASGNTVCNVTVNQEVTIISTSTNYYYEVEFNDEESGEIKKGWISKRSVKLIEDTSECETNENKTENTEEVS